MTVVQPQPQPRPKQESAAPRRSRRPPTELIAVTVKVRGTAREEFVDRYCTDVVAGGMLVRTGDNQSPPLGARLRFRFVLEDGSEVFSGEGQVSWIRRGGEAGIGMRFDRLDPGSERVLRELLAAKERLRDLGRPEFDEAPTRPVPRVVPAVRLAARP